MYRIIGIKIDTEMTSQELIDLAKTDDVRIVFATVADVLQTKCIKPVGIMLLKEAEQ